MYVHGSLNVFNHRTNVDINNRIVCFDIKELGKQLKSLGMLVIQDQVWNRVSQNRDQGKSTWYFVDEFHLLLRGEVGSWSVEIWKRFRKWGGIPTGITQNIKDLLSSPEIENIFENSDFVYLLNQASGDRKILCERLNISNQQAAHICNAICSSASTVESTWSGWILIEEVPAPMERTFLNPATNKLTMEKWRGHNDL